jgi:hypothetical protein
MAGLLASASVQVVKPKAPVELSQMKFPLSAGNSQQPKQSQPLGTNGKQKSWHAADWAPISSLQLAEVPCTLTFGSYAQVSSIAASG